MKVKKQPKLNYGGRSEKSIFRKGDPEEKGRMRAFWGIHNIRYQPCPTELSAMTGIFCICTV